ncbi:shiftless antiviral inhibitor of ribosomal frameshifting protein homolog [Saccostrea echinata]|uniref:shiftless antiviral inhibitor of ribosomal frameshifting protein homolog n=1 Tax=Saccostrea echinata TaxID=191078 RepID=UPI002A8164C8|nr:shiftless antiviral inhibitor of ribosomal frameshifting protein homolog [Saccostrea echinata]
MADILQDREREKKIGRLQELFRGRFSVGQARRLLEHHGWNLEITTNFIFEADPEELKRVSHSEDEGWQIVLNNRVWRELAKQAKIPEVDIRQFACRPCDSVWWRRVPGRKTVSKCHRCRVRYDAIPKEHEWGLAQFECDQCGNVFIGFGQMNNNYSPCYACGNKVQPARILPKRRSTGGNRRQSTHSCFAYNCYNIAGDVQPGICVHPKSLARRVVTQSDTHASSGSTVDTFLTQDDLASFISGSSRPNLSDVDEEN